MSETYDFGLAQTWYPYFDWLFQSWVPKTLLEFGAGDGTQFFLDHCAHVTSVEIAARPIHFDWWEKCQDKYCGYDNWEPLLHEASPILQAANNHAEAGGYPLKDRRYLLELRRLFERTLERRMFDLIFVDAGIHNRGDLVNLAFNYTSVVAAHDTNISGSIYGWDIIDAPDFQRLHFPATHLGTTFWIRRNCTALIDCLRAFPDEPVRDE